MSKIKIYLFFLIVILTSTVSIRAQNSASPDDEPDFIVPARPTVSNPAEFQKPGVLQLEFGYDGNFRSPDYKSQHDAPLALRFAVNRRLLLELDTDSPYSQTDSTGFRQTGAGDTALGIQTVLQPEKKSRPGISFAYYVKIPTASAEKNLGTGKVDQSFIGLISKKFGIQGEISGFSRNDEQTGEMLGLGVATYQINKRVVLDSGVRFGLTHAAPNVGFVAGITVGVADLYKKHH